jgi:hypothetical protein
VLKALSKGAAERYQRAGDFLTALRNLQLAKSVAETLPSAPPVLSPPPGLRRSTPPTVPTVTVPSATPADPIHEMEMELELETGTATPLPPPTTYPAPPAWPTAPPQPAWQQPQPVHRTGPKRMSNRLLWVALGALCTLVAIIVFIQSGTHQETNAKVTTPPVVTDPNPPVKKQAKMPDRPARQQPGRRDQENTRADAQPAQVSHPDRPSNPSPAPQQPPQTPSRQQPTGDPSKTQIDHELPPEVNRNRMVVAGLGEQLDMLVVRANALRVKLAGMQQSASHPPALEDWIDALNAINGLLRKATQAVDNGDAATARSEIQKAATQMDALEKAISR